MSRHVNGADWAILVVVVVLFVFSIFLALSETAFTRMSRIRALALADEGNKRAERLAVMLEQPQQTLNSVLLLVLVSQLTTATLIGVLLEGAAGAWGVVIGIVLQIFLFFVIGEVAPKTFAVQHTERAALSVTPLLWFLTQFAPLRWLSKLLIGVANVVLPGKGLKTGPFVTEEEIRTMADVAAERRRHRARGAGAHPLDLRVRRHRRARGDAAQPRRRDRRLRRDDRGGHLGRDRARLLAAPVP